MPQEPPENLDRLSRRINELYDEHSIANRYSSLNRLSLFVRCKNNFHELRGTAVEIRDLGLPLLKVWEEHMNARLSLHRRIRLMLQMNVLMERILDSNRDRHRLPTAEAQSFQTACFTMLQMYKLSADHFAAEDPPIRVFGITVKPHHLCHCAINAAHLHPRHTYCYRGEDYMRVSQEVSRNAIKCGGFEKHFSKFLESYKYLLHVRWSVKSNLPIFRPLEEWYVILDVGKQTIRKKQKKRVLCHMLLPLIEFGVCLSLCIYRVWSVTRHMLLVESIDRLLLDTCYLIKAW